MNFADIKVYMLNATALTVSFASVESALKLLLLVVSIGYTAQKWHQLHQEQKRKKDTSDE